MLYRIADFMTKRRTAIEAELGRLGLVDYLATKAQLQQVLGLFGELGEDEIDLAICYTSPTSESLLKINYCDLLDKFQVSREEAHGSASREGTGEVEREDENESVGKETDEGLNEEELSFG